MCQELDLVRRFRGLRVLLIGDALLDTYIESTPSRICREGPIPLFWKAGEQHICGGAANVAANLRVLGATVSFLSVIGDDQAGVYLRGALDAHGIRDRWLFLDPAGTPQKTRFLSNGQYIMRLDDGPRQGEHSRPADPFLQDLFHQALEKLYADADVVVISDYDYGVLSPAVLEHISELHRQHPKTILVDSQALHRYTSFPATIVTPNLAEAQRLVAISDWRELARHLLRVLERCDHVAITLAEHGVFLQPRSAAGKHIAAHAVAHAQDVGAGDTFAAACTLALAAGGSPEEAVRIGIDAAGIAVSKPQTAQVSNQELLQRVAVRVYSHLKNNQESSALERLSATVEVARVHGQRIVFTNGIFDIVHAGHIDFLRQAKELGDLLIVGVNTDESAHRLKGAGHPVNNENDRLALISALDPVDYTVLSADTANAIIERLRPDVYVKGGDYDMDAIPEAPIVQQYGGTVMVLPLVKRR